MNIRWLHWLPLRHMLVIGSLLLSMPVVADMRLEKVVLVYRHGARSPLPGEVQVDEANGRAWPLWPSAAGVLTAHGKAGVEQMGRYDRRRLSAAGLFAPTGCPPAGSVSVWANTDQRTIASAQALADAFAPGCGVTAEHLPEESVDPIFNPVDAKAVQWDGVRALAAIAEANGGPQTLTARHAQAMRTFARVMGCRPADTHAACTLSPVRGAVRLGNDGRSITLTGPIAATSGTSEVILMEYVEGFPMADVGWGRADLAAIRQLSSLHSLLFDIHARPTYIAERVAAVLSAKIVAIFQDAKAPRLSVFVGSDNNIVALAAVLGIHFSMPGYGADDAPVGGALGIELWRSTTDHKRYVHMFYQAQTLDQLRLLQPLTINHPPALLDLVPATCRASPRHCDSEAVLQRLRESAAHRTNFATAPNAAKEMTRSVDQ